VWYRTRRARGTGLSKSNQFRNEWTTVIYAVTDPNADILAIRATHLHIYSNTSARVRVEPERLSDVFQTRGFTVNEAGSYS
jgi:hypothetical protein